MNEFIYNFLFPFLAWTSVAFVTIAFCARRVLHYQESYKKSLKRMAYVAKSRTFVLAMQFSRLQTFGIMYLSGNKRQRDDLLPKMSDYLKDTSRHLEDALQEGDGFEEGLFLDIVLEAATEFNRVLLEIRDQVDGFERTVFEQIVHMSSEGLKILQENGNELVKRFNSQLEEITGEKVES